MLILMRDIISLQRSPFSTVPRSFLKVMTMTTGEFDFDAVFRKTHLERVMMQMKYFSHVWL